MLSISMATQESFVKRVKFTSMKKVIMFLLFAVITVGVQAQTTNNVSAINGDIIVEEVVQVQGKKSQELYSNALAWISSSFSNPNSVIKNKEKEIGIINLKFIVINGGTSSDPTSWLDLSLKLQFKDGRYKYTFSNIWLRWCDSFHSYGAKDEPYYDYITRPSYTLSMEESKRNLLKDLNNTISGMKRYISTPMDNDW